MKILMAFLGGMFIPLLADAAYAQAVGAVNVIPVSNVTIAAGFGTTLVAITGIYFRMVGRMDALIEIGDRMEQRDLYREAEVAELRHNTAKVFQTLALPGCSWEDFKTLKWKDEPKPPRV